MSTKHPSQPWLKGYPSHLEWNMSIPHAAIHQILERTASNYPTYPCMEFEGKTYRYKDVDLLVRKLAKGLKAQGVKKGTKVGLFLPNCPFYIISYYAILSLGGVVVGFNPLYSMRELQEQIDDSETAFIITLNTHEYYYKMMTLLRSTGLEALIIADMRDMYSWKKRVLSHFGGEESFSQVPYDVKKIAFSSLLRNDGVITPATIDPEKDPAVLIYTSGIKEKPKKCLLSHANLSANVYQISQWLHEWEDTKETVLAALPFFHSFAMTIAMNVAIYKASHIVLLPKFETKNILKTLLEKRITILPGIPAIFLNIIRQLQEKNTKKLFLKWGIVGGATLPEESKKTFESLTNSKLIEAYTLTEAAGMIAMTNPDQNASVEGGIGMPLPQTSIEIHHTQNAAPVKLGDIGEIYVSGPQITHLKGTEKENYAGSQGPLESFATGDMGYLDKNGYVTILNRKEEVIQHNDETFYPHHFEEILYKHPSIAEVVVIHPPIAKDQPLLRAFIVVKPKNTLTKDEILAYLQDSLASPSLPSIEITFIAAIPVYLLGNQLKQNLLHQLKKVGDEK